MHPVGDAHAGFGHESLSWAMLLVGVIAFVAAAVGIEVRATFGAHVAVDETQYVLTALSLAEDRSLDISDELGEHRWREFADAEPPVQTEALDGGRQISPHDPLLPALLALPVGVAGWVGAKLTLAALAGLLAALTLWTAVRRLRLPLSLAAVGVAVAFASPPLAVYGQQIYPELPAALVTMVGVAAFLGPCTRGNLAVVSGAVAALPWLSVKYGAVAAVLALLALVRWWRTGDRIAVRIGVVALAVAGAGYLVVHRLAWGGWTVYASGDHFQQSGELGVVGFHPDYFGRGLRFVGLFVDREYGIATWQPAWLLLVPAAAAAVAAVTRQLRGPLSGEPVTRLASTADLSEEAKASTDPSADSSDKLSRRIGSSDKPSRAPNGVSASSRPSSDPAVLLAIVVPGWLVATFVAVTMHGYWWPGRQLVVVLPVAVLLVLAWLRDRGPLLRRVALGLGLIGVGAYVTLLVDGYQREITWVSGFQRVDNPLYAAIRHVLPDYRRDFWPLHIGWIAILLALLVAGARTAERRRTPTLVGGTPPTTPVSGTGRLVTTKGSSR